MSMNIRIFTAILMVAVLGLAGTGCSTDKPMPGATVGNFMDDSYLTSAVKTKLLGDEGLKSFHIKVITDHQVVTLSGTLPTAALRDQAVAVAKSVGGVKEVIDSIEIKAE
ncbi:MAG: BON domain-containing protein [Bacillota bacterium]